MKVEIKSLGLLDYKTAWNIQIERQQAVIDGKLPSMLYFVEHPKVLTLGASFHPKNLIYPRHWYANEGIAIEETDRGGDVTYHGPGQLVIYPVFDISQLGKDLHKFIRQLEQAIVFACSELGVVAETSSTHTGIWSNGKILGSIGIKVRKWVSIHGISLNCDNDLTPFSSIIPCGLEGFQVTSLTDQAFQDISPTDAIPAVIRGFETAFSLVFEK